MSLNPRLQNREPKAAGEEVRRASIAREQMSGFKILVNKPVTKIARDGIPNYNNNEVTVREWRKCFIKVIIEIGRAVYFSSTRNQPFTPRLPEPLKTPPPGCGQQETRFCARFKDRAGDGV
jgi:hypothetical protein